MDTIQEVISEMESVKLKPIPYTEREKEIYQEGIKRGKESRMIENIGAYSQVDYDRGYKQGREDTIDECIQTIKDNWYFWNIGVIAEVIKKLEQLKEK